jgi:hypothetical protein
VQPSAWPLPTGLTVRLAAALELVEVWEDGCDDEERPEDEVHVSMARVHTRRFLSRWVDGRSLGALFSLVDGTDRSTVALSGGLS